MLNLAVVCCFCFDFFGSVWICPDLSQFVLPSDFLWCAAAVVAAFAVAVVAVVVVVALRLDKVSSRSDWNQGVL